LYDSCIHNITPVYPDAIRTIRTHAEYRIMPTSGGQAIAFSNVDSLFSKVLLGMIGIEIFGPLRRQTACHLWLALKLPINLQG
jgi:hypothetical protein